MVRKFATFVPAARFQDWLMETENLIWLEKVHLWLFLAYGWSEKNGLFLEINFNPKKGGFF